ncbi:MAG: thioredoxin family protein [Phycisphaerales bacterium JB043]
MEDLTHERGGGARARGRIDWFWVVMIALLFGFYWYMGRTAPMPDVFANGAGLFEAVERSEEEGKVVVAVATADWCGACQVYKREALVDKGVTSWLRDNAIPVYIDVDDEPDAAVALGVRGLPATIVIRDGQVLEHLEGAYRADDLLAVLERSASD